MGFDAQRKVGIERVTWPTDTTDQEKGKDARLKARWGNRGQMTADDGVAAWGRENREERNNGWHDTAAGRNATSQRPRASNPRPLIAPPEHGRTTEEKDGRRERGRRVRG